jgi:hypothetical protein
LNARGFAEILFIKYPWANTYARRLPKWKDRNFNCTGSPSVPGTVEVCVNFTEAKVHRIVNMFAQVFPSRAGIHHEHGSPYNAIRYSDKAVDRQLYFQKCLAALDLCELDVVAMPFGLGCGLGGGKWAVYEKMLRECKTNIVLYKI